MKDEPFVYLIRPDGTSLWIGEGLAQALGFDYGHRLTVDEYGHRQIQELIAARKAAERKKGERE